MLEVLKQALEALEQVTKELLAVRDELAERGARPTTNVFHQRLWDSSFSAYTDHAIPAAQSLRQAIAELESQEPDDLTIAYMSGYHDGKKPQRTKVVFPTMLRKMWSGSEVQAWLDENVNKEKS